MTVHTPSSTIAGAQARPAALQALENLHQALRVLDLADTAPGDAAAAATGLCPPPLVVVRAEIENARRYLTQAISEAP